LAHKIGRRARVGIGSELGERIRLGYDKQERALRGGVGLSAGEKSGPNCRSEKGERGGRRACCCWTGPRFGSKWGRRCWAAASGPREGEWAEGGGRELAFGQEGGFSPFFYFLFYFLKPFPKHFPNGVLNTINFVPKAIKHKIKYAPA